MNSIPLAPPQASEHAAQYDALFWTISGLTVIFTIIVGILVLTLAVRYRRGSKVDRSNAITHSTPLELAWTIIPLFLAIGIFAWSTINFIKVRSMPKDAMEVFVIGKQWMWHLQHMDGTRENNQLHLPVGTPVKMTMISQDVIHAMYLPDFRAQFHVVPGRYTELHFTPTKPGTYKMLCAMHCGTQHAEMVGDVIVMPPAEFAAWKESNGNRYKPKSASMVKYGEQLFEEKRCGNCHGSQDNVRAPSLYGIYGSQRTMTTGETVTADEEYLRESILRPYDKLTEGYDATMSAYQGLLTEEDVYAMTLYIKSLGASDTEGKVPFEMQKPPAAPPPSSPENATDAANRLQSGESSQFEQSRITR